MNITGSRTLKLFMFFLYSTYDIAKECAVMIFSYGKLE